MLENIFYSPREKRIIELLKTWLGLDSTQDLSLPTVHEEFLENGETTGLFQNKIQLLGKPHHHVFFSSFVNKTKLDLKESLLCLLNHKKLVDEILVGAACEEAGWPKRCLRLYQYETVETTRFETLFHVDSFSTYCKMFNDIGVSFLHYDLISGSLLAGKLQLINEVPLIFSTVEGSLSNFGLGFCFLLPFVKKRILFFTRAFFDFTRNETSLYVSPTMTEQLLRRGISFENETGGFSPDFVRSVSVGKKLVRESMPTDELGCVERLLDLWEGVEETNVSVPGYLSSRVALEYSHSRVYLWQVFSALICQDLVNVARYSLNFMIVQQMNAENSFHFRAWDCVRTKEIWVVQAKNSLLRTLQSAESSYEEELEKISQLEKDVSFLGCSGPALGSTEETNEIRNRYRFVLGVCQE